MIIKLNENYVFFSGFQFWTIIKLNENYVVFSGFQFWTIPKLNVFKEYEMWPFNII